MYLLTNERYKIYQTGFSSDCLGDAPGVGLGGTVGVEGVKKSEIQPELVCQLFFGSPPPWALGEGPKVNYHSISITKSISNIFKPNFVCILTNERYKKI